MVNYSEEVKRLGDYVPSGDFWKPAAGQHKVKAMSELIATDPFKEEGKEPSPQVKILLLTMNKDEKAQEVTWTIPVSKTLASAYGQLCTLGKAKGELTGVEFMIVVKHDGKKNSYTIVVL